MIARFGPAGNSDSFYDAGCKSTLEAPEWVAGQGLNAYEYQCGRGVRVSAETAAEMGRLAAQHDVQMSLHAPYFISLASAEEQKRDNSIRSILESARAVAAMGGERIVVHPGGLGGLSRAEATALAAVTLRRAQQALDDEGLSSVRICPETMGKINQLGDLDEVLELCTLDVRLVPCIDFGHLYARSLGADDGAEAFHRMLERVEEILGAERAGKFHSHFSHIQFTPNGGEKCHRTFADDDGYGPDWAPLAAEVVRRGWSPTFICESAGTQAEDARIMKDVYLALAE